MTINEFKKGIIFERANLYIKVLRIETAFTDNIISVTYKTLSFDFKKYTVVYNRIELSKLVQYFRKVSNLERAMKGYR